MNFKVSIAEAVDQLSKEEKNRFTTVMRNGNMTVEYYAPQHLDLQKPHQQDELYIIASGSGIFYRNKETVACKTGDVLFVPAGMEHRFENFTTDFATWVIFYGPESGENG
jgi:mannose-6-phosphate isomerase-like protein (cupin superfamily)